MGIVSTKKEKKKTSVKSTVPVPDQHQIADMKLANSQ